MIGASHEFQQRGLNALDENGNEGCARCGRPRDVHPDAAQERPAPGLAERVRQAEDQLAEAERTIDNYRDEITRLLGKLDAAATEDRRMRGLIRELIGMAVSGAWAQHGADRRLLRIAEESGIEPPAILKRPGLA